VVIHLQTRKSLMKNKNCIASGLLCGILLVFAGCATAPQHGPVPKPPATTGQELIPLELFWNGHDNFTTATVQGEADAKVAGYNFIRIEGYVFKNPQSGTVPLKQYWSAKRHDYMLLGKAEPKTLEKRGAYQLIRIEGYAYAEPQPDAVPLKRFKHGTRDNITTATAQGENSAIAAGYVFQSVEAYVIPAPGNSSVVALMPPTNYIEASNTLPVKVESVSADQIQKWIAQLDDSDFSKRESAVNELAQHSATALPALKEVLKTETDSDRRWWIQSAIQECQKSETQ
jgi:hypothetical protein